MEMTGTPELDIQAIITDFVADPTCLSIELPHMTTGQRKNTKKALEEYPELKCESFGFGKERKLHLFKVTDGSSCISTKDTSVDYSAPEPGITPDPEAAETESLVSHPTPTNSVQCIMDGPVCKLDLTSIKDAVNRANGWGEADSTVAPSSCPSDCSPASTFRGIPPWFRLPPGLELEVQNTFIHYKKAPENQRAVQSMPHCMFQKCLLSEALSSPEKVKVPDAADNFASPTAALAAIGEENCSPAAGTEVVIEGLSKFPDFNGLRGTLQSLDEESGRYNILLSSPVRGHKTVKVKRENFCIASASEGQQCNSEPTSAPRALKLNALV